MKLFVEISPGELLDKITILEIKLANITEAAKLANVRREYDLLTAVLNEEVRAGDALARLRAELKSVNAELWTIEDAIRAEERAGRFGAEFIALARSVYRANDRRAALKREINLLLDSALVEEKSYAPY